MGNRAVITWGNKYNYQTKIGVYLHWNGGRTSVQCFLDYCRMKGYPMPNKDNYGLARFIQVVSNFFGGGSSVGVDLCANLDCDNYDNGTYLCEDWEVVDHLYSSPNHDQYDPQEFLKAIDAKQPKEEQLGRLIDAYEVAFEDLEIGDHVFFNNTIYGTIHECEIIGFGTDFVNGSDRTGTPFVDLFNYKDVNRARKNPNCYVYTKSGFDNSTRNNTSIECKDGYCFAIKKSDL